MSSALEKAISDMHAARNFMMRPDVAEALKHLNSDEVFDVKFRLARSAINIRHEINAKVLETV